MIRTPSTWCLFIYYLTKLIKLINKNIIYSKNSFSVIFLLERALLISFVSILRLPNISLLQKVSMGSSYFDEKLFISKFFMVESSDAESSEAESFKVESLLPMPLSVLYTKSLT